MLKEKITQYSRMIGLGAAVLVLISLAWWVTMTNKTLIELAEVLMWSGGICTLVGGMIVVGAQADAWSDGGIVFLDEVPAEERMKRIIKGIGSVVVLVGSGVVIAVAGFVLHIITQTTLRSDV